MLTLLPIGHVNNSDSRAIVKSRGTKFLFFKFTPKLYHDTKHTFMVAQVHSIIERLVRLYAEAKFGQSHKKSQTCPEAIIGQFESRIS